LARPDVEDDKQSPARVFTANNTPSFVISFENLPMPTEKTIFVRNLGRRMHHVAHEIKDGDHGSGEKKNRFYREPPKELRHCDFWRTLPENVPVHLTLSRYSQNILNIRS